MIDTTNKANCAGCRACEHICPKYAINMKKDKKGFLYPEIDYDLCIQCDLCEKVCDFRNRERDVNNISKIYYYQSNDEKILNSSTSGGAFSALSDILLNKEGYVAGAVLDRNLNAIQILTNDSSDRNRMKGSKYIQSDTCNTYKETKRLLKNKHYVVYTGTPCQIGGLKSYLELDKTIDMSYLYTIDFICHGTPSPKIFKDHISYLEKKYGYEAVDYKFRDKKYGWCHTETIQFKNGKNKSSIAVQQLKEIFYKNLNLRECCYNCAYANKHRPSDITIADFWGVDKLLEKYDYKGTSMIICNNKRAIDLVNMIEQGICFEVSDVELKQGGLNKPAIPEDDVEVFWHDYFSNDYNFLIEKYAKLSKKMIIRIKLKQFIHIISMDSFFITIKHKMKKGRK